MIWLTPGLCVSMIMGYLLAGRRFTRSQGVSRRSGVADYRWPACSSLSALCSQHYPHKSLAKKVLPRCTSSTSASPCYRWHWFYRLGWESIKKRHFDGTASNGERACFTRWVMTRIISKYSTSCPCLFSCPCGRASCRITRLCHGSLALYGRWPSTCSHRACAYGV